MYTTGAYLDVYNNQYVAHVFRMLGKKQYHKILIKTDIDCEVSLDFGSKKPDNIILMIMRYCQCDYREFDYLPFAREFFGDKYVSFLIAKEIEVRIQSISCNNITKNTAENICRQRQEIIWGRWQELMARFQQPGAAVAVMRALNYRKYKTPDYITYTHNALMRMDIGSSDMQKLIRSMYVLPLFPFPAHVGMTFGTFSVVRMLSEMHGICGDLFRNICVLCATIIK
jgi:hypothetical protein